MNRISKQRLAEAQETLRAVAIGQRYADGNVAVAPYPVNGSPVGNLEEAIDATTGSATIPSTGSIYVSGWAASANDGSPLRNVLVYIDGVLAGSPTLGIARPDVAAYFKDPAYLNSGFTFNYPAGALSAGSHSITVVATGSHSVEATFGPQTITVIAAESSGPIGNLEQAVDRATGSTVIPTTGTLYVSGWAANCHDKGPAQQVQIFIDGELAGLATLGQSRPDVAASCNNPAWVNTGYIFQSALCGLSLGTHAVTSVAIDSLGLSATFGPQTFTVTP